MSPAARETRSSVQDHEAEVAAFLTLQRQEFIEYWCWRADTMGAMEELGEATSDGFGRIADELGITVRTLHRFLDLKNVSAKTEEKCRAWARSHAVTPRSAQYVAQALLVALVPSAERNDVYRHLRVYHHTIYRSHGIKPWWLTYKAMPERHPDDLFPARHVRALVADMRARLDGHRSVRHRRVPWTRIGPRDVFRLRRVPKLTADRSGSPNDDVLGLLSPRSQTHGMLGVPMRAICGCGA
jgi:hypothetical protein